MGDAGRMWMRIVVALVMVGSRGVALAQTTATTVTLEHAWPEAGAVRASTEVTLYGSGYGQALPPLGCRFGEVVADKNVTASTSTEIVCATPRNVLAGFVALGIAQYTGRRYVQGADDLVVYVPGQLSFEFVKPWKLSWVNPEYVYRSGGETLRLTGEHFRPGMQCAFVESSLTSEFRFISSALATCESRASSFTSGTLDLSLTPDHAVGGTTASIDYQTAPIIEGPITYTTTWDQDVRIRSLSSAPLSGALASFTASPVRIGCWFDGVWVLADLRSEQELVCKTPSLVSGSNISLSVMDMYSQRMFSKNSSQQGWFTISVEGEEIIDVILPEAGSAMRSNPADASTLIEFHGENLVNGSESIATQLCVTLNPETVPLLVYTNATRSKCAFPSTPSETVALRSLSYGFHALLQGAMRLSSPQFQIVPPPQPTSVVPGYVREGSVVTFSGLNMRDENLKTSCKFADSFSDAYVVSSALVRCVTPLHDELPQGSPNLAHAIEVGVTYDERTTQAGVSSMNWVPLSNDLASITPHLGSTSGGTRVVLKISGGTIPTASYYTPMCRFGTILTSAIHVPGGGVACSSPAHIAENVTVGIDVESTLEFQYVSDISVASVSPPALPQSGGNISVVLDSSLGSLYSAACVFVTSSGDKWKSTLDVDRNGTLECATPETGIGFATMAVVYATNSTNNTAFIDEAAGNYLDIEVQTNTPSVDIFLQTGVSWVQAEEVIYVVSSDGMLLGDSSGDDEFYCVFGRAAQYGSSLAHRLSAAMLKCEVRDLDDLIPAGQSGFEVLVSICSATEYSAGSCSGQTGTRLRYEKRIGISSLSPVNGTDAGAVFTDGVITSGIITVLVNSSVIKGFGASVPSCKFGTIYPVLAMAVTTTGELNCVTPAHVAGNVPVSVPPLDLGLSTLTFTYISVGSTQSDIQATFGTDPYVSAYLIDPTPMITELSPWVGWSGSVITLSGTHFPTASDVKCRFGSVSIDAQVVSTAMIRCGPTTTSTSYDVEEQLVAVTTNSGASNPNVTALPHYVTTLGVVDTVDASDGWQQGGNTVGINVANWVPEGYTTCLFGTVSVQSRGGDGYGAIGKASVSRVTQWWTDSTGGTNIECVSPAQGPGNVAFGISITGSSIRSFNGTTFTYI